MNFDTEQLNLLMQSRRSTFPRQYDPGKTIPNEVIQQLLENSNLAPTHKITEPWRFTVFTKDGLKKFGAFQANQYKQRAGAAFTEDKYLKMLNTPLLCSHIISIGMKRHSGVPEIEEIAAVACAVQNMYLTATAYHIGCYWTTGGVTYDESAKSFFGLEATDKLMGFLYTGVIATPSPKSKRSSIEEKVNWVM